MTPRNKQRLNGGPKWVAIALTMAALVWNAVTTYSIKTNDLAHLTVTVEKIEVRNDREHAEIKAEIKALREYLMQH